MNVNITLLTMMALAAPASVFPPAGACSGGLVTDSVQTPDGAAPGSHNGSTIPTFAHAAARDQAAWGEILMLPKRGHNRSPVNLDVFLMRRSCDLTPI